MGINIDVHQLAKLAQILNRMRNRLRAFKDLPDGYRSAETLDIEEIKTIFNSEFKKGGEKDG